MERDDVQRTLWPDVPPGTPNVKIIPGRVHWSPRLESEVRRYVVDEAFASYRRIDAAAPGCLYCNGCARCAAAAPPPHYVHGEPRSPEVMSGVSTDNSADALPCREAELWTGQLPEASPLAPTRAPVMIAGVPRGEPRRGGDASVCSGVCLSWLDWWGLWSGGNNADGGGGTRGEYSPVPRAERSC